MLETAWESRWLPDSNGGVAQLGEHLPCKQGVKSSNLSISIEGQQTFISNNLYLENRILKNLKVSKFAKMRYNKTSEDMYPQAEMPKGI